MKFLLKPIVLASYNTIVFCLLTYLHIHIDILHLRTPDYTLLFCILVVIVPTFH
jgi:hypothetical protein